MWALLAIGLAFGGKWDGVSADIVATKTYNASPEALFSALSDPKKIPGLFPIDCADWEGPFEGEGVGANTVVTYWAAGWHRKLALVVSKADANRVVEFNHPGNKGFTTRFLIEPEGGLQRVTMTTYLLPPPWPFKPYFYKRVKPDWVDCQQRVLDNLGVNLPPPAPVTTPEEEPIPDDPVIETVPL